MRRFYFTVDVDRDVNVQVPGGSAAGSLDRGAGTAPRFSSSDRGLGIVLDILDEAGIRGTLFFEGRTAEVLDCARAEGHRIGIHGYDHEDLTQLADGCLDDVVRSSFEAVSDNVGGPTCSRAPYMSADRRVLAAFERVGIRADSSFYTDVGGPTAEYSIGTIREYPVPKARDPGGRTIAAYLWPMHEGKRDPADYMDMAAGMDGPLVLADHSWHFVESRAQGMMSEDRIRENARDTLDIIQGILDLGYEPCVIGRRRTSCRTWTEVRGGSRPHTSPGLL